MEGRSVDLVNPRAKNSGYQPWCDEFDGLEGFNIGGRAQRSVSIGISLPACVQSETIIESRDRWGSCVGSLRCATAATPPLCRLSR